MFYYRQKKLIRFYVSAFFVCICMRLFTGRGFIRFFYWAQNEMYMGGDRKKEKRFVGQRVVYDDGIKAYKTKCLRGFN